MTTTLRETRRIGQQSTWTVTFTDDVGDRVDPVTVRFRWRRKSQSIEDATVFQHGVDSEITREAVGVYSFRSPVYEHAERHYVRVESTLPNTANEQEVTVERSLFVESGS